MRLETDRLVLRNLRKSDAESVLENIDNLKVSRYLSVVPFPYTRKDFDWWFNHCVEKRKAKPMVSCSFAIVVKPGKKSVGNIGLTKIDTKKGVAHIGYWIGEKYWRKGYMFEAAARVIDYAFEELGLKKIIILAFVENAGSNGLIKKLGLRLVKTKKKGGSSKATGKVHDENVYEISRDEWGKR
jgi:RimJ/RimL family protein N-acetyltransferase